MLIPTILSRRDLDRFEQANNQKARLWYAENPRNLDWLLSREGVRTVHKRMFDDVWAWAGTYRSTEKNIGVDPSMVQVELENLLADTRYWMANETYAPEEIAVRFKHRLVFVHCFPNGNGRHSRFMADLLISIGFDGAMFGWGGDVLGRDPDSRDRYIGALKQADKGDICPLLDFAMDEG